MKKNNKGFTLIELLAIIVILAIIAVITVPIILNIIENSRKGAAVDSAYGYKDAVSKYYVSQMLDNPDLKLSGDYKINKNGKLEDESGEEHSVATSGTLPSNGYITIENNEIIGGCLTINDYKVDLNDKDATATKGKCEFLEAGTEILFDPGSNVGEDTIGKCVTATDTCMTWYVLNDHGSKVDLLLDHDTTALLNWISQTDYEKEINAETIKNEYGITYQNNIVPTYEWNGGNHAKGPLTALKQLDDDTKYWSDSLKRNDGYSVSFTNIASQSINYTIDYTGYKARMVKAEEIADITGVSKSTEEGGKGFDIENKLQSDVSIDPKYDWIYSNTGVNNGGYWTSSAAAYGPSIAVVIFTPGKLSTISGGVTNKSGVRPVITVSKSLLSQE